MGIFEGKVLYFCQPIRKGKFYCTCKYISRSDWITSELCDSKFCTYCCKPYIITLRHFSLANVCFLCCWQYSLVVQNSEEMHKNMDNYIEYCHCGGVNHLFYGWKLSFTALLMSRYKTKFPTIKPMIYLLK